MPPLTLSDYEALAVLLGLVAGRRTGLVTTTGRGERIRRRPRSAGYCPSGSPAGSRPCSTPSPSRLRPASTRPGHRAPAPRSPTPCAIAVYLDQNTACDGRRSQLTSPPYGLVAHSGRWYVTGADPGIGEDRTFRLDRIADKRAPRPACSSAPAGFDPAQHVLSGLAKTPYRHEVTLSIQSTSSRSAPGSPPASRSWRSCRPRPRDPGDRTLVSGVELHAERLDWLPPPLASLDLAVRCRATGRTPRPHRRPRRPALHPRPATCAPPATATAPAGPGCAGSGLFGRAAAERPGGSDDR